MVQTPIKPITLDEFLALPETTPTSEFIDGQIIQKPMPQGKHRTVQRDLIFAVEVIVKPQKIARAFPELRCTFGGRSIVPDIAVFLADRIPRDANGEIANVFPIAPDWTIEILSPGQNQTKVTQNILHCLDHGCQMGWLLDPEEKLVLAFPADARSRSFSAPAAILPAPAWAQALQLTVGEVFSWLSQ
jgi:Uma2 family endonuclease